MKADAETHNLETSQCANCPNQLGKNQKRFCSLDCVKTFRKRNYTRKCKDCDKTPEEVEFGKHPKTLDGLSIVCKPCNRKRVKTSTANYSPERKAEIAARFKSDPYKSSILMRTFGIDLVQYKQLLSLQNGLCAICKDNFTDQNPPHVDHDHATGIVRELLCRTCNWGLGQFKDNPHKLLEAIAYIERTAMQKHRDVVHSLIARRRGEARHDLHATRGILPISREGRLRLMESQGFMCACCKEDLSHRNFRKINIDHDHKGRFIRGALCKHCNVGLGLFYEDAARFRAAIQYLTKHSSSALDSTEDAA